jgi:LL-diaminopimelate aminotransferase
MAALKAGYLFPEVARRRRAFQEQHPEAKIISLGVGNTTEPLTPHVTKGLIDESARLGTRAGYSGYGDEQGLAELRARIAEVLYKGIVKADEVFVSDGAKCDIGRLQLMFGAAVPVAVQDPSYPVYVDGSVIIGAASGADAEGRYGRIVYLPCLPANGFMPDLAALPRDGLVYFCSPNNPTGAVATRKQLEALVAAAKSKGSIIIFDAAYAEYIRDPGLPRSIFEIEGARSCALEVNSFSKPVGFTGVRLGWTVVPRELRYADGSPVAADWNRMMTTLFNGASNVAQHGGLAALEREGRREGAALIAHYMGNADLIRKGLNDLGVSIYGGDNAPYIWASFPGRSSWEVFGEILERCHVVTTPGSGFGPGGEGFIRFSAFGKREDVVEAVGRLARLGGVAV